MSRTIFLEKQDPWTTLTTWIYCHFWMMHSADQLGYKSYINWPQNSCLAVYKDPAKFKEIPNMYEWYFEQPMFTTIPPNRDETWVWEGWQDPSSDSLMGKLFSSLS